MGINRNYFGILRTAFDAVGRDEHGLRMCEFGCQILKVPGYYVGPAKLYFEGLGIEHTAYDLNGDWGSERIDLGRPIPDPPTFHMVTDFGTSEHVPDQWTCFGNAHALCAQHGVMVHVVPTVGHCAGHGMYTYPVEFFEELAELAGYEIVERGISEGPPHLRVDHAYAILRKLSQDPFVARPSFDRLPIERDPSAVNVGNYEARMRLVRKVGRYTKRQFLWYRGRVVSLAMRAGYQLRTPPQPRTGANRPRLAEPV